MILDKVFHAVLNQGRRRLLVYEKPEADLRPFLVVPSSFRPFLPLFPPAFLFSISHFERLIVI